MSLSGRHNCSGSFCLFCPLSISKKKDPSKPFKDPNSKADLWTIQSLKKAGYDVINKYIPMENIIPPILHIEMGLWNHISNILLLHIRNKLEDDLEDVKALKKTDLEKIVSDVKLKLKNTKDALKHEHGMKRLREKKILIIHIFRNYKIR